MVWWWYQPLIIYNIYNYYSLPRACIRSPCAAAVEKKKKPNHTMPYHTIVVAAVDTTACHTMAVSSVLIVFGSYRRSFWVGGGGLLEGAGRRV